MNYFDRRFTCIHVFQFFLVKLQENLTLDRQNMFQFFILMKICLLSTYLAENFF